MKNSTIPKKAFGATTNTCELRIVGLSNNPDKMRMQSVYVGAAFTSDEEGETLSLYDPTTRKMVMVPYGEIEKLVEFTRNQRKKEGDDIEQEP